MMSDVSFTERESQVIRFVSHGKTNTEIAVILNISSRTVGFHLQNIYKKLGVSSRTQAAVLSMERIK